MSQCLLPAEFFLYYKKMCLINCISFKDTSDIIKVNCIFSYQLWNDFINGQKYVRARPISHYLIYFHFCLCLNSPETRRLGQIVISQASLLIGCLLLLLPAPETPRCLHGREISFPIVTKTITHNTHTHLNTHSTARRRSRLFCQPSQLLRPLA